MHRLFHANYLPIPAFKPFAFFFHEAISGMFHVASETSFLLLAQHGRYLGSYA